VLKVTTTNQTVGLQFIVMQALLILHFLSCNFTPCPLFLVSRFHVLHLIYGRFALRQFAPGRFAPNTFRPLVLGF